MAGYGTVSREAPAQNGTAHAGDEETAALLGYGNGKASAGSIGQRFKKHMCANVSTAWGDIALLGCYVITGLLDSCAVFIWGSFLSMQTGMHPLPQQRRLHTDMRTRKHNLCRSRSGCSNRIQPMDPLWNFNSFLLPR